MLIESYKGSFEMLITQIRICDLQGFYYIG